MQIVPRIRQLSARWRLAAVGMTLALGCSGPQPLATAIRPGDQQAFRDMMAQAASPKAAFFAARARETGRTIAEVEQADAAISATKNPFDANHDPAAVSRGAVIYQEMCMRCHGQDVRGGGPDMLPAHPTKDFHAFDKRFAVTLHGGAPRAWFKKISEGYGEMVSYPSGVTPAMPAFKDTLAAEQIWLAITYLQSLDARAQRTTME